jgi:16S rRNA (adenine1518-N6/adenine1519-N6)-dimethyltransferase
VLAVELDERLRPVLRETLADCENAEVLFSDVLKQDLPALVKEHFPGLRPVVCANLPYNVTSPLLTAFLEAGCFETVTVMIQREVARRLCAKPGTADYGAFTVFTQWHAEPEILFDVSPGCFLPAPKVTSSVVRLTVRKAPPVEVISEKRFFAVVRAAFNQRRKTLLNALSSGLSGFTKEQIAQAIAECGLDEKVRGEALGIAEFARLSDRLDAMAKETTA